MKRLSFVAYMAFLLMGVLVGCDKEPQVTPDPSGEDTTGTIESDSPYFSVSTTKQVEFAPGNLDVGGRSFTEHQYDYGSYFRWGTGAFPVNTPSSWDYSVFYDWGDSIEGGWRTLTIDEWDYVLSIRPNARDRQATATVNEIHGLILLPDGWVLPEDCSLITRRAGWGVNVYTAEQWEKMEAAGAVFLPAGGSYSILELTGRGERGFYWSSTSAGDEEHESAYGMSITSGRGYVSRSEIYCATRASVRLVRDIK